MKSIPGAISGSSQHHIQKMREGLKVSRQRHHNAQSPSHKLPAETLAQIFQLLIPIVYSVCDDVGSWDQVTVTWVCHYWREVALASPMLWSFIKFDARKQRVKEMLKRSQGVPLSVYVVGYTDGPCLDRNFLLEILRQTHRLQRIYIYMIDLDDKFFEPLCTSAAPQLHTLELHEKWHIEVPDNLFTQLPNLRNLRLTNCRVNWSTFKNRDNTKLQSLKLDGFNRSLMVLNHLTTLCVDYIGWLSSLKDILECLEQLTHLRILELHDAVLDDNNVNAIHQQTVEMPELLRVSLSRKLSFTNLLDYIATPKLISATFEQFSAKRSVANCSSLYSLCSRLGNGSIPCRQLKVGLDDDYLYIAAWRDNRRDPEDLLDQPLVKIGMEMGHSVDTSNQDIMKEFLRRLSPSLSSVRQLTVLVNQISDIDWIEIFGSLDKVETIRTDGFEGLAKMLCHTRNIHTQPALPFPMLRNLVLDTSVARKLRGPMVVTTESVDMFIQYCKMAHAGGEGMKNVVLNPYQISEDDVELLAAHAEVSMLQDRLPFGLYKFEGWHD